MTDRLDRAWELRRDVHAWVKAHPDCGMREIGAAFGGHPYDTIRRVVSKMNRSGCLMMCVASQMSIYRAVGEMIEARDAARNELRRTGRMMGPINGRTAASKLVRNANGKFEANGKAADGDAWRHYTNRPDRKPAVQGQRGQGAAA